MKYYVFTIEQVYNDGVLGEYATKSDAQDTRKAATEAEMKKLGVKIPNQVIDIDVELGDYIKVVSGAWEGTDGKIKDDQTIGERVEG